MQDSKTGNLGTGFATLAKVSATVNGGASISKLQRFATGILGTKASDKMSSLKNSLKIPSSHGIFMHAASQLLKRFLAKMEL